MQPDSLTSHTLQDPLRSSGFVMVTVIVLMFLFLMVHSLQQLQSIQFQVQVVIMVTEHDEMNQESLGTEYMQM